MWFQYTAASWPHQSTDVLHSRRWHRGRDAGIAHARSGLAGWGWTHSASFLGTHPWVVRERGWRDKVRMRTENGRGGLYYYIETEQSSRLMFYRHYHSNNAQRSTVLFINSQFYRRDYITTTRNVARSTVKCLCYSASSNLRTEK